MAKWHTFPTLYDDCKTVSINKLKEWGYLDGTIKSGTVHWSRNGSRYASIGIEVNTFCDAPFIELDYKCNGKPVKYRVKLVTIHSNIGKGRVWYFICPNTGKRCRKLYMVDTYFLHREAFSGAMYEKQTHSKYARGQLKLYEQLFGKEEAYGQLYSKYFKKYYKGKPTKRYLRICKALQLSQDIFEKNLLDIWL